MRKSLIKLGAPILALGLIVGCNTNDDKNNQAPDDNVPVQDENRNENIDNDKINNDRDNDIIDDNNNNDIIDNDNTGNNDVDNDRR